MRPLCVDLDGTIISTDTLFESMLLSIKQKPVVLLLIPIWVLSGRANLKEKLSQIAIPNPEYLPYKEEVLDFIRTEKSNGRRIILVSATQRIIAESVAKYLGLFDEVLATDSSINLRSKNKKELLVKLYGEKGFDYIGDSSADFLVWASSNEAILVEPSKKVLSKAKKESNVTKVFKSNNHLFKSLIKEIRVYQWLKNVLIFLPLLMAHKSGLNSFWLAITAFISFSLTASFVYVLNDLLDLESDRQHPRKKFRPFASGKLSIHQGFVLTPILLLLGFGSSLFFINYEFSITLLIYLIITTAYSFYLKKVIILDLIILSCLYTIRLIAGAAAVGVEVSQWLLGFSIFFFLSLAIMKRYTELRVMIEQNKSKTSGRGYHVEDISFLRNIGPASGYLSVLIFALYVNSEKVISLYHTPQFLWLTLLCLLYWISRIWIIAQRGNMHDDPIVFTAKDPVSYIVWLLIAVLAVMATF